jgi:hypothetical protein
VSFAAFTVTAEGLPLGVEHGKHVRNLVAFEAGIELKFLDAEIDKKTPQSVPAAVGMAPRVTMDRGAVVRHRDPHRLDAIG